MSQGIRPLTTAFVVALAHGCADSSGEEELEEEDLRVEAAFELPVEVIGAPGTIESRSFLLDATTAPNAKKIYLRINNLSYENKARVRVNGGEWVSLNHDTVSLYEPENARGGMTHGGYNTVRMTLPLVAANAGENKVEFEFHKSDGISIGYRVVEFNLLDASGKELLAKDFFREDDPNEWTLPLSDSASIQAGEALWKARNRLKSNYLQEAGWWYDNPIPLPRDIKAACADCHTADGRDLEIFAYSNHAIIERAKFHGLTEVEGEQIASYIRSLSGSGDQEIGRYGRPWNPPFQPGPSVAERPVHEWPAGAGLAAVLETDADMLKTMFPGSQQITQADVNAYFDRTKLTDATVQPLAIQFPDWKHWLPLIHPMDAFSNNNYWDTHLPQKEYERIRNELEQGARDKNDLLEDFHRLSSAFRQFLAEGGSNDHWRTKDGDAFNQGLINGITKELAATSLARLQAVKFFEFHTEFSLMGMTNDEPGTRGRQFIGRGHQVFNPPPHFTGCYTNDCDTFDGQSGATGDFETTNWYQLQQVLNPGNAAADFLGSMDYNYQPMYILRASASSKICEPVRYFYSQLIQYQTRGRTDAPPEDESGFYIRQMGPWQILGADNRNDTRGLDILECLNGIQEGLGSMFVGAQLQNFLAIMDKDVNDTESWPRREDSGSGDDRFLEDNDISKLEILGPSKGKLLHYAHKIYASMGGFLKIKVNCATFNEYRAWAEKAWPNVDWEDQFKCQS